MNNFSTFHWIIFLVVIWFLYRLFITRFGTRSNSPVTTNKSSNIKPVIHWETRGEFEFKVVGESFHQSALSALASPYDEISLKEAVFKATLFPDDNNKYDKLAVRVDINGLTVGHLSKDDARSFRRRLSNKKMPKAITSCDSKITGGFLMKNGQRAHYGVMLDIKLFNS